MAVSIDEKDYDRMRLRMVDFLRSEYKIRNETILNAMAKVRRHVFIPEKERAGCSPYGDYPCPIGHGQTISQPYIVAYMTDMLDLKKGEKVLEIGTGSGYQAAILSNMGVDVFSVEIIPELAGHARRVLHDEGYRNVHVWTGDGYKGWSEYAPYDAIIVTCAPESVPQSLVGQLRENGRMIVPEGTEIQTLVVLRKSHDGLIRKDDIMVRFVPMVFGKSGR